MSGGVLVFKFGGAALATPRRIRRASVRIGAWQRRGMKVVVVTSACGTTTDRLLRWTDAVTGSRASTGREIDRALATGEDLSCSLFAAALIARGIPSLSLRGSEAGMLAQGPFGRGAMQDVDPQRLLGLLADGIVPVVAGFQAARADGETITLGRGSSDLSAVHFGAAVGAECVHLVKDVDGIHDRDPHAFADTHLLRSMNYDQLERLVLDGAQIVHLEAVRLAREQAVPLRIYGFKSPISGDSGTVVGVDRSRNQSDPRELLTVGGKNA